MQGDQFLVYSYVFSVIVVTVQCTFTSIVTNLSFVILHAYKYFIKHFSFVLNGLFNPVIKLAE